MKKCAQCGLVQKNTFWLPNLLGYCSEECRDAGAVRTGLKPLIAPSKAVAVVRPGGFSTREPEE